MTTTPHIDYVYMPLGYDCSPTFALKELGLYKCSFPFDYVQSNHLIVKHCIEDEFQFFHQDVMLINGESHNGPRVIDHYGVQYPHDYPPVDDPSLNNIHAVSNDDAFFPEVVSFNTYKKYKDVVLEKYRRRIDRFYEALRDKRPIIILMRELFRDAMIIKEYLEQKFNRNNIMFVVAADETHLVDLPPLMTYFNPSNDTKKDLLKWKEGIDRVKQKYEKVAIHVPHYASVNHAHTIEKSHSQWF